MCIKNWLQGVCRRLASPISVAGHRRLKRSSGRVPAMVEQLEPRQLLSAATVGPEFRVNTTTPGFQVTNETGQGGSAAMDAAGNFVAIWASYGQDNVDGSAGVYAQRYNAAGVVQGGEFRVNTFTPGNQKYAKGAMDNVGDFVIAWTSYDQDGSGAGVYAQRYDAAGVAQGGEFPVNTTTTNFQGFSTVAMDAAGDSVISWTSAGQDGNSYGIFARRYNTAGVAQGGEFQVNTFTTGDQNNSTVAMDSAGDFVVTWSSNGQDGSAYGIYAQKYNAAGVAQGGEFPVNSTTTNNQRFSTVAMDTAGDFVVTWVSNVQDGSDYGIYARRYNAAGVAQGGEFRVNTTTTNSQRFSTVAMDTAGDFVVTWTSYNQDGSFAGVYLQQYSAAGVTQGGELRVNSYTFLSQVFSTVAMDNAGDFVVVWTSDQDGSGNGVYAQRYAIGNHAPAGMSATLTAGINTPYTLKASDFGFTDPNDTPPNALLAVKFTLLPTSGILKDNGIAMTVNQLVSATDINSGKLVFTPNTNLSGGPFFLAKFQVQDNGGTANSGVNLDPTANVLSVKLVPVNHAPVGASGTVAAAINTPYLFKTADFGFTDPNDTPANSLLAVKITLLPGAGTLTDNGAAVTVNQFVSASDISSGKLVFTPNTNLSGGPFFLAKFQVQDNGGTAGGGVNLDPTAKVLNVNLVHMNHAPVGTSGTVSAAINTPYLFKTADFGFTDPNDTPANSLLAVKITLLPGTGILTDNGVAVTVNQFVSASDISSGKLVFTPNHNLSGGPFFLAKFQVQDNGGTAGGGVNLDTTAKVLYIGLM